jgi:hypothetical protein
MDTGEPTTGTRDEQYNLIAVLYHALHGAENCEVYAVDAEAAGDERLGAFFREAQAAQTETAERAKELLGISSDVAGPGALPADAGNISAGSAVLQSEAATGDAATGYELPPDAPTEEIPLTTNMPRVPPRGTQGDVLESEAPLGPSPSTGDAPPQVADDVPDEPPGAPPSAPSSTVPLPDEDLLAETGDIPPDAPAEGEDLGTSVEAPSSEILSDSPREAPPPGEERPERRGVVPSTDTTREAPPPGEERPERRTP